MGEEMLNYKQKYAVFMEEAEKRREKQAEEFRFYVEENEYKDKFIALFTNMLAKIHAEISPDWSLKKQIAVGWKVVKCLVKKALKLGVQPPQVVDKEELFNQTKFQL